MGKELIAATAVALAAGVAGLVAPGASEGESDGIAHAALHAAVPGTAGTAPPRRAARARVAPARPRDVVHVRRGATVSLRDAPGGNTLEVLDDTTPFGSRATFAVVAREGEWLGVYSNVLRNGDVGWIRYSRAGLAIQRHRVRIVVDRSERRLDLIRRGRRAMSVSVGVGRPGSETPLGTFAVTDRLGNGRWSRSYGCCVIALTGRQTRLPSGWRGGDRLAIHGTDGRAAAATSSAGCVAVDAAPLRRLMRSVPLGTLVTIRA